MPECFQFYHSLVGRKERNLYYFIILQIFKKLILPSFFVLFAKNPVLAIIKLLRNNESALKMCDRKLRKLIIFLRDEENNII